MSVRVQLDRPHDHFTNLDFVTGRVILQLPRDETIASVVVKLEGESKMKLEGPRSVYGQDRQDNRTKAELEVHKLLYKVLTVFPSPDITSSPASSGYTLKAGQHSYPFEFKIPFNNDCSDSNSAYTNLNFAGLRMEMAKDTNLHVKSTLPPSLNGFPGRAEIRYYVKATIARPSFYKENYRSHADIKFLPIEPPRLLQHSALVAEEAYARRHFEYANTLETPKKKGLFGNLRASSLPTPSGEPPRITIDARLPNPPIITCNEPLPLRVLIRKESDFAKSIHLQSLQIELIAYTKIRAHDFDRTESGSWVVLSLSNLDTPIGLDADSVGAEWVLNSSLWNRTPLPNTVAPAFETCNISRRYELEARVGLTYGRPGTPQSQLTVHPLRMPVQVYSGVAPPPALLSIIAESQPEPPPFTPTSAKVGEAPPSYEDAMASELAPVDGPRREYAQANAAGPSGFGDDRKVSTFSPSDRSKVV